jgi:hypothetical protein
VLVVSLSASEGGVRSEREAAGCTSNGLDEVIGAQRCLGVDTRNVPAVTLQNVLPVKVIRGDVLPVVNAAVDLDH